MSGSRKRRVTVLCLLVAGCVGLQPVKLSAQRLALSSGPRVPMVFYTIEPGRTDTTNQPGSGGGFGGGSGTVFTTDGRYAL